MFQDFLIRSFPSFYRNPYLFFFALTLLFGGAILLPHADFQPFIAQGDHGRDLYCFKQTMDGGQPYRDYSWVLGPLMPYYYGLVFKIFGPTIQSAILGQNLLIWANGVLCFTTAAIFISPAIAWLCALSYWAFRGNEFFYTYVHTGGLLFLLLTIYSLFRYFKTPRLTFTIAGTAAATLLMLVRVNMGVMALFVFLVFSALADKFKSLPRRRHKIRFDFFMGSLSLLVTVFTYWFFLKDLPQYALLQSLPYLQSHRTDLSLSVVHALALLGKNLLGTLSANGLTLAVTFIFALCALRTGILLSKRGAASIDKPVRASLDRLNLLLAISSLLTIILLGTHEYLASEVNYRLLWVFPAVNILLFFILDIGSSELVRAWIRTTLIAGLLVFILGQMAEQNKAIALSKTPESLFISGDNKIYSRQSAAWLSTVNATVNYVKNHVPENENIFAVPFDPLYYFLCGKKSPTRQLILFEHGNITPEQENLIISDLERNAVTHIILSNRGTNPVACQLGIFGKTYCPLLGQYVNVNFHPVAQFGNFSEPAGWASGHATMILKRNF